MRNPHGNLICPKHGSYTTPAHNGNAESGPWGVTCGYWRCSDERCCLIDGEPKTYGFEKGEQHEG